MPKLPNSQCLMADPIDPVIPWGFEGQDVLPSDRPELPSWSSSSSSGFGFNLQEQERLQREKDEADDQHLNKLYTDEAFRNQLWDTPKGRTVLLNAHKPEEIKEASANWNFLERKAGRALSFREYPLARKQYGLEQYGLPEIDDKTLFGKIRQDYELDNKRKVAYQQLYSQAVTLALMSARAGEVPKGFTSVFESWKETNKDILQGRDEWETLNNAYRIQQNVQDLIARYGDPAVRSWEVLDAYQRGEAGEAELRAFAESLARIPKEDQMKIYQMATTAAGAEDGDLSKLESAVAHLAKSVGSGLGFTGLTFMSAVTGQRVTPGGVDIEMRPLLPGGISIPVPTVAPLAFIELRASDALTAAENMPEGPARDAAIAEARHTMDMVNVVRELQDVAINQIQPTEPYFPKSGIFSLGTLERGVHGIGGSLGWIAATAVNPVLGGLAIWTSEYDSWRRDYPEMRPNIALAGSLVSAVPQAIIEKFQVDALAGKLPFFHALTRSWRDTVAGRIGRKIVAGGIGAGTQTTQEFMQDAISEFTPALFTSLQEDVPQYDWQEHAEQYVESRPEVIVASTIFGLVGAGAVDLGDFKNPMDVINDRQMTYAGIRPIDRDRVFRARTDEEKQAAIAQGMQNRTAASIEHGKKVAEADFQSASQAQMNPDAPTMRTHLDQETGERVYTVTRSQEGELTELGQKKVSDYQALIDCLGR